MGAAIRQNSGTSFFFFFPPLHTGASKNTDHFLTCNFNHWMQTPVWELKALNQSLILLIFAYLSSSKSRKNAMQSYKLVDLFPGL